MIDEAVGKTPDDVARRGRPRTIAAEEKVEAKVAPVGMPKTVKIMLEDSENMPPTGCPVAINGYAYIIRPGEVVDVPPNVIEVLDHAVMSVAITDPQTKRVIGYRDRLRFPYRIVTS
jgi:hypothetical protein